MSIQLSDNWISDRTLFRHKDGSLWILSGYWTEPTAILRQLYPKPESVSKLHGGVGCRLFEPFTEIKELPPEWQS